MPKIVVKLSKEDYERLDKYAASVWDYPHEVAAWIINNYFEKNLKGVDK